MDNEWTEWIKWTDEDGLQWANLTQRGAVIVVACVFFNYNLVACRCADLVLVQWSCCELIDRYKFGFPSIGLSRYQVLEC